MSTEKMPKARSLWFILSLLLMSSLAALPACEDDDEDEEEDPTLSATASLDAEQETAEVVSDGTGTFEGTYDSMTGELTFTLTWSNLTGPPTMMHFHGPAEPGSDAGVKIGITGFPESASGSVDGTVTVAEADRADLLAGRWYVNIHTEAYGPGEIRGQVIVEGNGGNGGGGGGNGDGY